MSQEELGERLGLTFQQIQKYERGMNRISASRIFDMARALRVPTTFFFDDMPKDLLSRAPGCAEDYHARSDDTEAALMAKRETLELVRAYYLIGDAQVRKKVYQLAKSLGKTDPQE